MGATSSARRRGRVVVGLVLFLVVASLSNQFILLVSFRKEGGTRTALINIAARVALANQPPRNSHLDDGHQRRAIESSDYMVQHARELEQKANEMSATRQEDLQAYSASHLQRRATTEAGENLQPQSTRFPDYNLHFFTYANDFLNITKARLVLQAKRSNFFQTVTALGPEHLPRDFSEQYESIINQRTGGGYYLWRYPIFEHILETIPPYDYFLFLDAGCTVLSTGGDELSQWLQALEQSSTINEQEGVAKEIMRFPEKGSWEKELRWTTDAVFNAFNISVTERGTVTSWNGTDTPQLFGGLWLVRNGPHIRQLLAFIYRVLAPDPAIITDEYVKATRAERDPRFRANRHDQSISSVANKLMGRYILAPPMLEWERPPFLTTRLRRVGDTKWTRRWYSECGEHTTSQRKLDEYCDDFALSAFGMVRNKTTISSIENMRTYHLKKKLSLIKL